MGALAHFTIGNLGDLISESFFPVDDYVDVRFIALLAKLRLMLLTADYRQNRQQVPTQHQRLVDERCLFLRADSHRRARPVLHVQLEDFCFSLAQVSAELGDSLLLNLARFSFLVSGKLENRSTVKSSLQEINYYDGDASAVTADLSNNVDVSFSLTTFEFVNETFQIYYHGPNALPSALKRIVNEDPQQKSYISLTLVPIMIKSQESTRGLFEFQRKCKFEEESNLAYFPHLYTQDLCRLECRMRKFRDACGCLPFFYRRKGCKS